MALKTTRTIDVKEVPTEWIFEHYLSLPSGILNGQDIKIPSVFRQEKTPSMCLYLDHKMMAYKYKDFSSGNGGDAISFVMKMFNITFIKAAYIIVRDYENFLAGDKNQAGTILIVKDKYKVTNHVERQWNVYDKEYWTSFMIGSTLLKQFNVKPLRSYTMSKVDEGVTKEIVIDGHNLYGYFKDDGTLYKIYQPRIKKKKFIKVGVCIQGSEQLTYAVPYLVICSSLKDVMAFNKLGFRNAEAIAPDSESSMIPEEDMQMYLSKYKQVCTLFDNDEAGINSMLKYQEKYGTPYVLLKMEKDLSDSIREHGIENTRVNIYPIITKALTGVAKFI